MAASLGEVTCFTKRKSAFSTTALSRFSTLVLVIYSAALCGFN